MKIAIDLDGVVADHRTAFWDRLGKPPRLDVYDLYVAYAHLDPAIVDRCIQDPAFYTGMSLLPGAHFALWRLRRASLASVYFVARPTSAIVYITARPASVIPLTRWWLARHDCPGARICGATGEAKAQAMLNAEYDVLIDDCPAIARACAATGRQTFIVQDEQWPYAMQGYGQATPVASLAEAVARILEVS